MHGTHRLELQDFSSRIFPRIRQSDNFIKPPPHAAGIPSSSPDSVTPSGCCSFTLASANSGTSIGRHRKVVAGPVVIVRALGEMQLAML